MADLNNILAAIGTIRAIRDTDESFALSRLIWKAIRPLAPPIFTLYELEKALIAVASDFMLASDASETIGIPLRYLRAKLTRLCTKLSVDSRKMLHELYQLQRTRVTQAIKRIVYKSDSKALLSRDSFNLLLAKRNASGKTCSGAGTRKFLRYDSSEMIRNNGRMSLIRQGLPSKVVALAKKKLNVIISSTTLRNYLRDSSYSNTFVASSNVNYKRLVNKFFFDTIEYNVVFII